MQLYATISGQQQAPAIILLHGLFGMGSNLSMVARALVDQYCVHSLDLRNHGRSPAADQMSFSDMAGDVIEYMDAQGIGSCHLLGHSLGGKVAMQVALLAPERVVRLIVADIAPVSYQGNHDDVFAGLNAVDLTSLQRRGEAEQVLKAHIAQEGVRQFILKSLYRDDNKQFQWRMNVQGLQACYEQLRQAVAAGEGQQFSGPVLFIKGELSRYIMPEHREIVVAVFPHADLKVIQKTGHWLHAEKTVAFNRLVVNFLAEP